MVTFDVERHQQPRRTGSGDSTRRTALGEVNHVSHERGAQARITRKQLAVDHGVVHRDGVVHVGLAYRQRARGLE